MQALVTSVHARGGVEIVRMIQGKLDHHFLGRELFLGSDRVRTNTFTLAGRFAIKYGVIFGCGSCAFWAVSGI